MAKCSMCHGFGKVDIYNKRTGTYMRVLCPKCTLLGALFSPKPKGPPPDDDNSGGSDGGGQNDPYFPGT